ncbi:lisH domain-containing protein C16orf63 [Trypanosoma cruzi]|uniref:Centrosomal protein 20 n=1 Tax=Trypanosoma cruzi TaxID=5693 RepID=A0A2V2W3N0_TRYCR|nr:putative LisH domain-containing protein FOPNL [Trypanosoma cruzi]PBJ73470.1 LisH domain-containing protein FOPNL (fopnl) [Trypanosoma cruzi cruzi]PWV02697.1 putative LisH domain-containing protein FOPNL [Trypanosoma cruzi]RNF14982.1 lisH domain-containing protein C16orf63 [Trypanosoma cruzi]
MAMARQESLKEAMREVLETKGVMDHVKAELRAAIFHALQDSSAHEDGASLNRPPVPPENLLLNELIKEYMAFNGMEHSLSVFRLESGSAKNTSAPVPRAILAAQLNMTGAPASVPLLYAMLHESRAAADG